MTNTNWFAWALLSAFFAGITAVLAKIGVANFDSISPPPSATPWS